MKIKSTFFLFLFGASTFIFFANCSPGKTDATSMDSEEKSLTEDALESDATEAATEPQFQTDTTFQKQLAALFTSYIDLKNAFVASDVNKVKAQALAAGQTLSKVDMKLLSGGAHSDWMNYLTPIQTSLKEIQGSADIEAQRKSFSTLSDNLYKSVKAFGLGGREAFYDYCPMAFNNEGGYWLSEQKQIQNPYFGDRMLTCGQVKEKLK
jgi:hypothetical protein